MSDASDDKHTVLGRIYGEIAREIANAVGGDPDGLYFHGSAGPGWAGGGIFKDEGDVIRWFDPSIELAELLIDAWEAEDPDKRWSIIEYRLTDDSFNARFTFPDDMDPSWESPSDGRGAALIRQFGDKPVIYPPMEDYEVDSTT